MAHSRVCRSRLTTHSQTLQVTPRRISVSSVSLLVTCNSLSVETKSSTRSSVLPSPVVESCLTFTRYVALALVYLPAQTPVADLALRLSPEPHQGARPAHARSDARSDARWTASANADAPSTAATAAAEAQAAHGPEAVGASRLHSLVSLSL